MSEQEARERARRLTNRYLVASTVILLAAGLLGEVLRSSQAGWGRVHDNFWYAMMTAHGLGAFVGWAGFAVMGLSWWVLAEVGLPAPALRAGDGFARLVADGARRRRRARDDAA